MTAPKRHPRPEHVFIGNHTWEIRWIDTDQWTVEREPEDADAVTHARINQIAVKLDPGAMESHYQESVVHEIMHAVWDATMLTHYHSNVTDSDREEFIVGASTPMLLFVIKQNPQLVAWLLDDGTVVR